MQLHLLRRLNHNHLNLLVVFAIASSLGVIVSSAPSNNVGKYTNIVSDVLKQDYQKPTFPFEDLRIKSSHIVKAHEIIREGLGEVFELKEEDSGTSLSYIFEKNQTFVDEHGQEIHSYHKVIIRPPTTKTSSITEIPTTPFTTTTKTITESTAQPTAPVTTTAKSVATTLSTTMPTPPVTTTTLRTTTSTSVIACQPGQFQCANKYCIDKNWRCNGANDCGDNSDELYGCQPPTTSSPVCQPGQFQCANRYCIDKNQRCNGANDCGDNSDEDGCQQPAISPPLPACQPGQFQCANLYCIDKNRRCDGANDCGDNSDENGCQKQITSPPVDQRPIIPTSISPIPSVLGPAVFGKTWVQYDCKIRQNGNAYDKNCNFKEVDQSQVGHYRQQLGPEISPYSPFPAVPNGYSVCNADSETTKNSVTGARSANVNTNYCLRSEHGTWISGSSSYTRRVSAGH